MLLSSRLSDWRPGWGPGSMLAKESPEDVDAASGEGEGDHGLAVGATALAF